MRQFPHVVLGILLRHGDDLLLAVLLGGVEDVHCLLRIHLSGIDWPSRPIRGGGSNLTIPLKSFSNRFDKYQKKIADLGKICTSLP